MLVRNPGWDAATDELRPAYPDRIEVAIGGNNDDLYNKIESNDLDFVVDGAVPPDTIREYTTDPDLQSKINVYASDALRYISFNFLTPPFDDIHVRKAFNWALDKDGMRQLRGGATTGEIAGHIMVNSLENNLLETYDPYATPNSAGDIEKAKAEMAQSKYDTNQDGVCDAPECADILAVTDREDPYPKQAALIAADHGADRVDVRHQGARARHHVHEVQRPALARPPCVSAPHGARTTRPATRSRVRCSTRASLWPSCCNYMGLGATPDQIKEWGYTTVTSVESVDDKIAGCGEVEG